MRRGTKAVIALLLAAGGVCLQAERALAQQVDPRQAAVAQALYDQAIPAMRAGDFAGACPKLEQVVALAPTGIGAKLMLAECYEGLGRFASAWTLYAASEAAAAAASQPERQKKAHDRAQALKPRLAMLTIVVPEAVRATPGLEIRRDGAAMKPIEWGIALPADTGRHVLVATAPGRRPWEKTVDIPGDGAQASVTVEGLAVQPVVEGDPAPRPAHEGGAPWWTGRRTAGVVLGAVGLAGVGVGSFFGVTAIGKKNQSNDGHCRPDNHCDAKGIMLRDEGLRSATAATALFIAGGAALVAGVVLVAIPPSAPVAQGARIHEAKVVLGPGGIMLRGTW